MGTSIKTRMTAGIIAVLSVLNFLFIPVSAAEGDVTVSSWADLQSAISNASQATTIVLDGDIDVARNASAITVEAGKNITLDLNGNNIVRSTNGRAPRPAQSFFNVNGAFTLVGDGSITGSNDASAIVVGANGEFTMNAGTISGTVNESAVTVNANGNFTMNAGTIAAANNATGVTVNGKGNFTLNDGTVTGANISNAVIVNGKFEMNGGTITGTNNASGVVVNGEFTMKAGTITKNNAQNGAGVRITRGGNFVMDGGVISENTATNNGGGVAMEPGSTFTMNNGTITGNTTSNLGGGVFMPLDNNTRLQVVFNLNGGAITNNVAKNAPNQSTDHGAGVYFGHSGCVLNLGAVNPIIITDNYDDVYESNVVTKRYDNLYVGNFSHLINITDDLAEGSQIGIRISLYNNTPDVQATSGFDKLGTDEFDKFFFIDQEDRVMVIETEKDGSKEIHCVKHAHTLIYKAEGNKLEVSCNGPIIKDLNCDCKAVLTLNATDAEYTGDPVKATFKGADEYWKLTKILLTEDDIKYFDKGAETPRESAPVDVGEYEAKYSVTVGKGPDAVTYTIVKEFCIYKWTFKEVKWTGNDKDGYTAEAVYERTPNTCDNKSVKMDVTAKRTEPTCEEKGSVVYTASISVKDSLDHQAHSEDKTVELNALGHNWEYKGFVWTEDGNGGYTAAQVKFVCQTDGCGKEVLVDADLDIKTIDATCEEDGSITYKATLSEDDSLVGGPYEDTKIVTLYATEHSWKFDGFVWTEDGEGGYTAAQAKFVCQKEGCGKEMLIDTELDIKTTDADCENAGSTVYTASIASDKSLDEAYHDDQKIVVINALGHDWGEVEYTWSDDNSEVTAIRYCNRDHSHFEKETVGTTSEITTKPSVDSTGIRTFTSDKFENPAFTVQTKKVDVAKLTPTPTVPADDPSIKLKLGEGSIALPCGKTHTIKASLVGIKAKIAWKSSNNEIATVDNNGKVTAKKAGSVTITASAVGKKASCAVQVLFKDVTDTNEFWYTPTYYLTDKKIVRGYENQTMFKPQNTCTRAQMITFIWRMAGEPAPKSKTCNFKDVKSTDYFFKACIWGNENHIVLGYEDDTFRPHVNCARRHAVTFLWRLAGKPKPKSTGKKFNDLDDTQYYYEAALWASEMKILEGYNDNTFRPDGDCLRRQMVTFLYKYEKFINKKV